MRFWNNEILGELTNVLAQIQTALIEAPSSSATAPGVALPPPPFLTGLPKKYRIYAWGAVLDREGNQNPHVHKDGYLSGCYYVSIPKEISAEGNGVDGDIAGGFEVGRPPPEYGCKRDPMMRQFKPYEGLMLLFPAYFYHRTIPFQGSSKRICIAFDVMLA